MRGRSWAIAASVAWLTLLAGCETASAPAASAAAGSTLVSAGGAGEAGGAAATGESAAEQSSANAGGSGGAMATAGAAGSSVSTSSAGTMADPSKIEFDVPDDPPSETGCDAGRCDCSRYDVFVDTRQSCAIDVNPATADDGALPLDAESFIEIDGTPFRVLAIDRWGAGHIVAWCDGTTLDELAKQFPLLEYLGQVPEPRIASIGFELFCGPPRMLTTEDYGFATEDVTYLGASLPEEYLDDPALMASEWDGLIVCMDSVAAVSPAFSDTIASFVSEYGGGLALVSDYPYSDEEQANLSSWAAGTGIEFVSLSLPWAPAATEVALECVADVPSILR